MSKLWGMGLNKDSQLGFQRTQHSRRKQKSFYLSGSDKRKQAAASKCVTTK